VPKPPYTIYSASAGSGKTSTLVKAYLKIILDTASPLVFREILAITFTNKAVNEMKTRILESLDAFSQTPVPENISHMFLDILEDLGLPEEELRLRAAKKLKELLHNYAYFDVSTIDKFNHRLIRTFARDLKLPQNFEVVLDTDLLLEEAIGRILARAGEERELTDVLVAFALEKIDEDRSWDIAYDLFGIGKLLFSETQMEQLEELRDKSVADFEALKKKIREVIGACEHDMKRLAGDILQTMRSEGLERSDFSNGYFPDFMHLIRDGHFNKVNYTAGWKKGFREYIPYKKACPEATRDRIDSLLPQWRKQFAIIKESFHKWSLLQNAYRNLVPLTILNVIRTELSALEIERDVLPISSFNSLISAQIKDQPAPFIYERLGERYRHYFIDEFQDTSYMQWQNLIPLIGNALEGQDLQGKTGSLMLVGDAKQAIYRWRGGKAEQFLNLINLDSNPFTIPPNVKVSASNYRSQREIVEFNNRFFAHISRFLNKPIYRELYVSGSDQLPGKKEGGYVSLSFIDPELKNGNELYCKKVLQYILEIRAGNCPYGDICILTRTRAQGVLLANYLIQQGIPIVSSETLLLQNNATVTFLIALLRYCHSSQDREAIYEVLYFLAREKPDPHTFIAAYLQEPSEILRQEYGFDPAHAKHTSAYDSIENAIRAFGLADKSDAYITYLLDEAFTVEQKEDGSITAFLEHWDKQRDKLSIVAPETPDAIEILTIHKAKGLEFPVVIYPFANTEIHNRRKDKDAMIWLPVEASEFAGFGHLLLSKKKEMQDYGELAEQRYREEEEKQELDAFNMLYVALTRAVKALYIISECDLQGSGDPKTGLFSGLFINYLMDQGQWDPHQLQYSYGTFPRFEKSGGEPPKSSVAIPFGYSYKNRPEFEVVAKSAMLWDPIRRGALTRGNQIHALMARIYADTDLENALETMILQGDIGKEEQDDLKEAAMAIMGHPRLKPYFSEGLEVRNECEILLESGAVIRPDRIVLDGKTATLIDYKTGREEARYAEQLQDYANALETMEYSVKNKIIVYINENVTPEFI
jgi:ATP-dependent exoDNAse (exonuclease V) beta subunit